MISNDTDSPRKGIDSDSVTIATAASSAKTVKVANRTKTNKTTSTMSQQPPLQRQYLYTTIEDYVSRSKEPFWLLENGREDEISFDYVRLLVQEAVTLPDDQIMGKVRQAYAAHSDTCWFPLAGKFRLGELWSALSRLFDSEPRTTSSEDAHQQEAPHAEAAAASDTTPINHPQEAPDGSVATGGADERIEARPPASTTSRRGIAEHHPICNPPRTSSSTRGEAGSPTPTRPSPVSSRAALRLLVGASVLKLKP